MNKTFTFFVMPDQANEPIEKKPEAPAVPETTNPVEREILELERQLNEKRAEQRKSVEQAIGFEQSQPATQTTIPPMRTPPSVSQSAQVKADTTKLSGVEKNQQLKSLVDLAFAKGVAHASEVVRNLDSPYLMDEFHDTLIDEFHKKLVDEGKLEEI